MTHARRDGVTPATITALLEGLVDAGVSSVALLDSEGAAIDGAGLASRVSEVRTLLAAKGIGRNDRVATVFPQGPDAAIALLGTMAQAIAAPLNPDAPRASHRDDLLRLRARLVLSGAEPPQPLLEAAAELELPVLRWASPAAAAGEAPSSPPPPSAAQPDDTALLLQTSGTTSRPKPVPLSHANLLTSAANVADVLELSGSDRTLAVMPLFHIHGIVTCLLAPLLSGGTVVCAESRPGAELLGLLRQHRITWLSAVPTLLQGLAGAGGTEAAPEENLSLRFLRSSSAPLAPVLARRLEARFGVPVIEAYGMTEAAHQICSNRLPPAHRHPGSVGPAAGPEVAVLAADHRPCPAGLEGEVAIRGGTITAGYLDAPVDGWITSPDGGRWFLTGDQGRLEANGVLRLTGRTKEMINRGGEKVIPRQVDEALLEHPAVEQAVSFAVPHPSLGEDLAAAVTLRAGAQTSAEELRDHCVSVLQPQLVPSRILLLAELPKGPTGKLQRIGLAERLGELLAAVEEPLLGELEELVGEIFATVLEAPMPSREGNFFALGGDSLTAQRVISRLNSRIPLDLPSALLFRHPTPRLLAAELEGRIDAALARLEARQGP